MFGCHHLPSVDNDIMMTPNHQIFLLVLSCFCIFYKIGNLQLQTPLFFIVLCNRNVLLLFFPLLVLMQDCWRRQLSLYVKSQVMSPNWFLFELSRSNLGWVCRAIFRMHASQLNTQPHSAFRSVNFAPNLIADSERIQKATMQVSTLDPDYMLYFVSCFQLFQFSECSPFKIKSLMYSGYSLIPNKNISQRK